MLNALKNNFGLKVLSFGLALAAWAYFHLGAAPGALARFDQTLAIPIVVTGLHPGYAARYADKTATVVVAAPRSGDPVRPGQVQAVLDVGGISEPGYHNVPVKIVAPDVTILSLSPASVTLSLGRIEDRAFPVSVEYVGAPHGVVVASTRVTPSRTVLRGVASDLAAITAVRVQIPMPDKPSRFDAMIRPQATGAPDSELSAVDISPNLVRVRAQFVASTSQ